VSPRAFVLAVCVALPALCFAAPAPFPRTERGPMKFVPPQNLADLALIAEKGGDVKRGAAYLRPKYAELDDLAKAFKPRRRGGIGIGPPANNDGLELKLYVLRRTELNAAQLQEQKADVNRLAHYTIAIIEVVRLFAPDVPRRDGKGAREWNAFADEVRLGARDLLRANATGDAKGVRAAAIKLAEGCFNCHDVFRDS
jgi:hypothetical protein